MDRARWAQWPIRGPSWVLKYPYCHQMITHPILGATKRFHENSNFKKLSRTTKHPIQRENGEVLTGKGPYGGGQLGVPRVET